MKFARLALPGAKIPLAVVVAGTCDLREVTTDIDGRFLPSGRVLRAATALADAVLPVLANSDASRLRLRALQK